MTIRPTIFALASGGGRSAVAVIRMSGPGTTAALRDLMGRLPEPRRATLATIRDPASCEALDKALVLRFAAPHSFTGEDAAELQLHGGRAVIASVLACLARLDGLQSAEPGEFTRRAFQNGKMDLTEVEGLADLINAETEAQRRQAVRQLGGALGRWASRLRQTLIEALALAEGAIDFAEDDDLVGHFERDLRAQVSAVRDAVLAQLAASHRAERLRDGLVVTIAGPPNVGKSTLLNVLAGRDLAIVSAYAGTTRDPIEVDLDLAGYPVRLIDTAGLRDTADPVEQQGILRARDRVAGADLVLWLQGDDTASEQPPPSHASVWTIATKTDLGLPAAAAAADFAISARTGAGIDGLLAALTRHTAGTLVGGEAGIVTRLRHRMSLDQAVTCLDAVLTARGADFELVAEDLRRAIASLSDLFGSVDTEEVLGSIFARFCIGK